MNYCQFQNTASDLRDCAENIEEILSHEEHVARERLVRYCRDIVKAADNGDIPKMSEDETEPEPDGYGE